MLDKAGRLLVAPFAVKNSRTAVLVVYFGLIFIGSCLSLVNVSKIEVLEGVIGAPVMLVSQYLLF